MEEEDNDNDDDDEYDDDDDDAVVVVGLVTRGGGCARTKFTNDIVQNKKDYPRGMGLQENTIQQKVTPNKSEEVGKRRSCLFGDVMCYVS